jgi:hypothetical protein
MDMAREDEVFEFLNAKRKVGALHAWGASYYLMKDLGMEYREAKDWDVWWRDLEYKAKELDNLLRSKP